MNSIELLKKYLHDHLIEKDGNFETGDLVEIRKDAKELGLDERQLSKLLQEVDSSINWEFIHKQKEEAQARESELKKAVEIQKTYEKNAGETLQFIIDQCAKDKVFDSTEIRVFFETSDELNQDENNSARLLKTYFEKNNYIPLTTPKGVSLRATLQSTDWHKDSLPLPPPPPPPPFPRKQAIVGTILALSVGLCLIYFLWLKPFLKDQSATKMYSISNGLILRSSKQSGADFNKLQTLPYGTEVLVYENSGDWASVKANSQEGFVSSQFILDKKGFSELNGVFGDNDSKETIATVKCRKALLDYVTRKNIMGKIDPEIQNELYGAIQTKEVWQVFSKGKTVKPNTVIYPRVFNSNAKFTDFGFLIKNIATNQRKFVLYTFKEDETPIFIYEADASEYGDIKSVQKIFVNGEFIYDVTYKY
jgi:hypothetical protein